MSMMECAHCHRPCDARSMRGCPGCGGMVCEQCALAGEECPGEEE